MLRIDNLQLHGGSITYVLPDPYGPPATWQQSWQRNKRCIDPLIAHAA